MWVFSRVHEIQKHSFNDCFAASSLFLARKRAVRITGAIVSWASAQGLGGGRTEGNKNVLSSSRSLPALATEVRAGERRVAPPVGLTVSASLSCSSFSCNNSISSSGPCGERKRGIGGSLLPSLREIQGRMRGTEGTGKGGKKLFSFPPLYPRPLLVRHRFSSRRTFPQLVTNSPRRCQNRTQEHFASLITLK